MSNRTYQTCEQYDAACERLAAHLNTLTADKISLAYADGYTEAADGTVWIPVRENMLETSAWPRWFMEEHGAAARFSSNRWVAGEPGEAELTDQSLAIWGEDSDDLGYPVA
jgi:hypothetical protein